MTDRTIVLSLAERDMLTIALHALREKFADMDENTGVEVGPVEDYRLYNSEQLFNAFNSVIDKLYPQNDLSIQSKDS